VLKTEHPIYCQFIAGEDKDAIRATLDRLSQNGIRPMLNYTVEEDIAENDSSQNSEDGFDKYLEYFLYSIEGGRLYHLYKHKPNIKLKN